MRSSFALTIAIAVSLPIAAAKIEVRFSANPSYVRVADDNIDPSTGLPWGVTVPHGVQAVSKQLPKTKIDKQLPGRAAKEKPPSLDTPRQTKR